MRSLARSLIYRAPGECVGCPACGSTRLYELDLMMMRRPVDGRRMGFLSGCEECGLVFSNPQPSAAQLAHLYSPVGDWGAPRGAGEQLDEDDEKPRGTSWARIFDPISDVLPVMTPAPGAAVLDFGCGDGSLLDALRECGWSTFGVEPSTDRAFRRHTRLEAVPERASFDLIVAHHVLEHLSDPLGLLRRFAAAARPGACLLVSVPRFDTLPVHRDYKYVINGHAHITAYTWPCLRTLLARAGWMPVAEPLDEIGKGGGRRTRARLRVLARRAEAVIDAPPAPARAARTAIRGYYTGRDRSLPERLGLFRVAARRAETRRRQALRPAKRRRAAATATQS